MAPPQSRAAGVPARRPVDELPRDAADSEGAVHATRPATATRGQHDSGGADVAEAIFVVPQLSPTALWNGGEGTQKGSKCHRRQYLLHSR